MIRANATREEATPLTSGTALLLGSTIGISAGQRYRTSNPVTDRPMIIRCISDVPSKIVKILAIRAVFAGQIGFGGRGISTDSARPVRDEFRLRAGPGRDCRALPRSATAGERGGREVGGHPRRRVVHRPDFGGISEVYLATELHLYPLLVGARTGHTGRGAPGCHGTPRPVVVAPTRRRYGPPWRPCTRITARRTGFPTPRRPASLASAVIFGMRSAAGRRILFHPLSFHP
jgi:hypothetical protein